MALQNAYQAIRSGECPAAVVGGINVLLKPNTSVQFMKLGMLSPDGTCKSFDESGELQAGVWGGPDAGHPLSSAHSAQPWGPGLSTGALCPQGAATAVRRPWWPSC